MTKSTITREQAQKIIVAADEVITALAGTNEDVHPDDSKKMCELWDDLNDRHAPPVVVRELARIALAAMDSESECLPLDYLQGHKDGLEWAAQLAEANHPETGDWLYDDPIELVKAIRKGPDIPPAQPVADSDPVIIVGDDGGDSLSYRRLIQSFEPGTKLYRHAQPAPEKYNIGDATMRHIFTPTGMTNVSDMQAVFDRVEAVLVGMDQPAPVVPDEVTAEDCPALVKYDVTEVDEAWSRGFNACRAAMLAAAPQSPGSEPATVPGKWIPVSERLPEAGVKVLCFPVEDEPIHAVFNGQLWLQDVSWSGSEEPIDNVIPVTVTHWMPLPAGPQEVR